MSNDPITADETKNKQPTRLSKFRDGLFGCGCLIMLIGGFVTIIESVQGVVANFLGVDRQSTVAGFISLIIVVGILEAIGRKDKK